MLNLDQLYVIVGDYSCVPWNTKIYTSLDEAKTEFEKLKEYKTVMYVLKLCDFLWQLENKKPSPRKIKL